MTERHDLSTLAAAVLVCALGTHSTFAMGRQMFRAESPRARLVWASTGILTTSSSIWATHFIAMLAFLDVGKIGFDVPLTVASFVVAAGLVSAATGLIVAYPGWFGHVAGGGVIGLAISAMHYTGMQAYHVQGSLRWDGAIVLASVVSGVVLAAIAMPMALSRRRTVRYGAPLVLSLAVCAAHLLGMTAVAIDYDPRIAPAAGTVDATILTVLATNVVLLIVGLSLMALRLSMRDHRKAREEKQRLRDLADIAVEGLLICDGERIVGLNRSLERMLSIDRDVMLGRPISDLLAGFGTATVPTDRECDVLLADGRGGIPVRVIAQTMVIERKPHTIVAVRDQRDRLQAERHMLRLAHEDALTGLSNRFRVNEALAARCGSPAPFALLTLDLDRFKAINDTLGHAMGDELLRRVARRLERIAGRNDLVARLGGDEFVILENDAEQLPHVQVLADNVIDVLSRPYIVDGHVLEISASVGIAMAPVDGSTPAELFRKADLALYRAKADGKGGYRMFEPEMDARMQARRALETDLRRAVARDEFEVHYQPQIDSRTGCFDGAEALVRWRHPDKGLVSPADFIPLAEETGLIGAIGETVLRMACTEAMLWPEHLTVAVNLSPAQFRDARLASTVATILAETGLPGHRLELEITESVILDDDGRTLSTLHEFKRLGIRISMDDFGTGYSSLSYLRKFPFDKIKIDQSFIRQTPDDAESTAIVRAILTLGGSLGMKITAEGVETAAQRVFVTEEGCSQMQGYLISRPVPSADIRAAFAATRPLSAVA